MKLDRLAYNIANYVYLSLSIIYEHVKCVTNIIKIIFSHLVRKTKLLLQNPVRLLFLPFTLPRDLLRFIAHTARVFVTIVKFQFAPPTHSRKL